MDPIKYTLTQDSVTVVWEGKPHQIQKGAPNYSAIRRAILDENWEEIPKHLTVPSSLERWAQGKFTYRGNKFLFEGQELPHHFNQRIISMATKNEDPSKLFKFWEKLQKNPSYRSVNQLWDFLQHGGHPLTEDGCFLAYKGVRSDFKDQHSGQFDNSPGAINEMPRNKISDDPKVACHEGFHVGALSYAQSFSHRVVVCKVDPEHVVCVPHDESQRKMRVCRYEVIGNWNGQELPSTSYREEEDESDESEPSEEEKDKNTCEECDGSGSIGYGEDEEECETCHGEGTVTPEEEDEEGDVSGVDEDSAEESEEDNVIDIPKKDPETSPTEGVKTVSTEKGTYKDFNKLNVSDLMKQPLGDLRTYASLGLKITGASKIPGGKAPLVSRIVSVREGHSDNNED